MTCDTKGPHGRQVQVMQGSYEFDWDKSQKFYVLLDNNNQQTITAKTQMTETCYNG